MDAKYYSLGFDIQDSWNIEALLKETAEGIEVWQAGSRNKFLTNPQRCALIKICTSKLCEKTRGSL